MVRRNRRTRWAVILVIALLMGLFSLGHTWIKAEKMSASAEKSLAVEADIRSGYGLHSPHTENWVTTWDCVWFGNYWQGDTNGNGIADRDDGKKPIKWRVLSVDGDDAFLLADEGLDCQPYNTQQKDVTWETCTLRSWLNGYGEDKNIERVDYSDDNFFNNAFTLSEQAAIQVTNVVKDNNPYYGTAGGNDTTDKVYLLSSAEVMDTAYGFTSTVESTKIRRAKPTEYAEKLGAEASTLTWNVGNGHWWLRSPGIRSDYISSVDYAGGVFLFGDSVNGSDDAVRPALHLNLSSISVWSKAGTVSSAGDVDEILYPNPTMASTTIPTVSLVPTAVPTSLVQSHTPDVSATLAPATSKPSQYKMTVMVKGNGATTIKTDQVYVSTEQMVELTVARNSEAVFTFIPEEGCSFVSLTIDGQKQEFEGNSYTISYIGQDHKIFVEFTEKMPLPTQSPVSTKVPPYVEVPAFSSARPPVQTEQPASVSTPHPIASPTPVPSETLSPDKDLSAITDGLGVSEETAIKIQAAARELSVSQDTILVTEQMIQSQKTDDDIKGSYFTHIQAKAPQITQKNIKLSWNRVKGADGYEIYGNRCNTKKWIYEYKKMKTIENGNKKSFIDRNCKKGTYYKYIVRAYKIIDGEKVTIAASKTIHVTTAGGKNGNAKSVKADKKKVSLKAGEKLKLRAWEIKEDKPLRHHREVSYESSDPDVATISKKGRIKAKKKGKCMVFAYAQSGVYKKVKVTVT